MVDVRPPLFVNALALMLLVTAGFASVRQDVVAPAVLAETTSDEPAPPIFADPEITEKPAPVIQPVIIEGTERLAMAEPVAAKATVTDTPAPKPEPPKTGTLVLRSNVVDDQVTINGKSYGTTRLDLQLDPGRYDVTIEKTGYKPWARSTELKAGQTLTLAGRLEAYTTVNYRNGEWIGGVKTGDGSWENSAGARYEGHFINGEFHGKGTLTRASGDILTGNWAQGRLHGPGSLKTASGIVYAGSFRNGTFHGQGALTYPDGRSYEGEFSNGELHGKGSENFVDGKRYDGQYMKGKFHGKGLLRNANGSSIEATFRHGEPYGQVRLTTVAGETFTARTTEPGVCYREKSYRATQCPQLEGW